MKPRVLPFIPEDECFFQEGCHIIELSNRADDAAVSIARVRVAPGTTTRRHRLHGVVERYVMLEGEGLLDVGEIERRPVGPGDVVSIPALCPQRIHNPGAKDLVFLAICTPRFTRECYEDIDWFPSRKDGN